mgnify:CR=1 FL=1
MFGELAPDCGLFDADWLTVAALEICKVLRFIFEYNKILGSKGITPSTTQKLKGVESLI